MIFQTILSNKKKRIKSLEKKLHTNNDSRNRIKVSTKKDKTENIRAHFTRWFSLHFLTCISQQLFSIGLLQLVNKINAKCTSAMNKIFRTQESKSKCSK